METDWQETLREVGESLAQADRLDDSSAKAAAVNDACRGLLGVVELLAGNVLAQTPDPEVGLP